MVLRKVQGAVTTAVAAACPTFGMQLLVSVVGLGVSGGMLLMGRDPAIYLPVVTSIIGYWLPAPTRPRGDAAPAASADVEEVRPPESVGSACGEARGGDGGDEARGDDSVNGPAK